MAINAGATAIGLVGQMPSGPGIISNEEIKQIASAIKDETWTVLLTSQTKAREIADHIIMCGVNSVQIVDKPESDTYAYLRHALPDIRIIQVIHVENDQSIDTALNIAPLVDVILLDSGSPGAPTKILGGTGLNHDWSISQKIVASVNKPVFLAGGIKPENIIEAITTVRPAGIDLCTGVRKNGSLSQTKLADLKQNLDFANDQ
jgi:phosphoribosylanthranilate isomerase